MADIHLSHLCSTFNRFHNSWFTITTNLVISSHALTSSKWLPIRQTPWRREPPIYLYYYCNFALLSPKMKVEETSTPKICIGSYILHAFHGFINSSALVSRYAGDYWKRNWALCLARFTKSRADWLLWSRRRIVSHWDLASYSRWRGHARESR